MHYETLPAEVVLKAFLMHPANSYSDPSTADCSTRIPVVTVLGGGGCGTSTGLRVRLAFCIGSLKGRKLGKLLGSQVPGLSNEDICL